MTSCLIRWIIPKWFDFCNLTRAGAEEHGRPGSVLARPRSALLCCFAALFCVELSHGAVITLIKLTRSGRQLDYEAIIRATAVRYSACRWPCPLIETRFRRPN